MGKMKKLFIIYQDFFVLGSIHPIMRNPFATFVKFIFWCEPYLAVSQCEKDKIKSNENDNEEKISVTYVAEVKIQRNEHVLLELK
jgi:hypothetical protein